MVGWLAGWCIGRVVGGRGRAQQALLQAAAAGRQPQACAHTYIHKHKHTAHLLQREHDGGLVGHRAGEGVCGDQGVARQHHKARHVVLHVLRSGRSRAQQGAACWEGAAERCLATPIPAPPATTARTHAHTHYAHRQCRHLSSPGCLHPARSARRALRHASMPPPPHRASRSPQSSWRRRLQQVRQARQGRG